MLGDSGTVGICGVGLESPGREPGCVGIGLGFTGEELIFEALPTGCTFLESSPSDSSEETARILDVSCFSSGSDTELTGVEARPSSAWRT